MSRVPRARIYIIGLTERQLHDTRSTTSIKEGHTVEEPANLIN